MSDYLTNLPWEMFRKIYKTCDTESKYNLTQCLETNGHENLIKRSGVHKFNERLPCFLCQLCIFYDEFCQDDLDRSTTGFHFLFTEDRSYLDDNRNEQVICYRQRRNNHEDREGSDTILKYFEDKLGQVYTAETIDELRKHVQDEHADHGYLPSKFWESNALIRSDIIESVFFEHTNLPLVPGELEWPSFYRYTLKVEEQKIQQRAAFQCTNHMLEQLRIAQNIGASWEPIYLAYAGGEPELWPGYKHMQAFRYFLDVLDKQHNATGPQGLGGEVHKSISK